MLLTPDAFPDLSVSDCGSCSVSAKSITSSWSHDANLNSSLWSSSEIKSRRTVRTVRWHSWCCCCWFCWLTFYVYSLYWSYILWSAGWKSGVIECQYWSDVDRGFQIVLCLVYVLHNLRCLALRLIPTKTCLLACDQSSARHIQLIHKIMVKWRTAVSGLMMQHFKFNTRINVSWMFVCFRPERPFICWRFT